MHLFAKQHIKEHYLLGLQIGEINALTSSILHYKHDLAEFITWL